MREHQANARVTGRLSDWGLLLLCNFIWASQFVLVKLVQDEIGPLFTTAFPLAIATGLLVPIVWWQRRSTSPQAKESIRCSDYRGFALLGIGGQVIAQLFATWGTQRSLASNAALISLSLPVSTALIAFFILHEHMSGLRWIGFILAIAGVVVASAGDFRGASLGGRSFLAGNIMVFLGVLGSAFYNVYSKKLLERFSALEVLLGSYVIACLLLVPVALVAEPDGLRRLGELSSRGWTGLWLLAVFQYCVSMLVFLTVLTRLDATQAAVSNYLIPAFGVVIAWLALGERLRPTAVIGGLLVLASTLLVTVWEERLTKRRNAS